MEGPADVGPSVTGAGPAERRTSPWRGDGGGDTAVGHDVRHPVQLPVEARSIGRSTRSQQEVRLWASAARRRRAQRSEARTQSHQDARHRPRSVPTPATFYCAMHY